MARNRKSAKAAGSRFERSVADYLRDNYDDRIDRRVKTGSVDKGDISNFRTAGNERIAVECKDYGGRLELATWIKEAEVERDNDSAVAGIVVAKRRGVTDPGKQWVICTLDDLLNLLDAGR